ncbi:MAG: competence/damage-inducible protein A [Bacteroidota bacterium]|nr:competence/damage-inducible protein A [Bacteroidota bacterium]
MLPQNINAEIITIGDEILIGQIIDSNSAWIAQQLNLLGINVYQITSISDNNKHIINALDLASSRADLILVTGGLGPTRDDLTKSTITNYFNAKLKKDETVLNHIRQLLEPKKVTVNELNIGQADVPDNCQVLHNAYGTAPGMWFEKNEKIYVFMPGVPFEMRGIVKEELLPRLKQYFKSPAIVHKTLMLQGIAESMLAKHIEPWELQLPSNIKLAYLPSPGIIRLRLTARGDSQKALAGLIDVEINKLKPLIEDWFFSEQDEQLEMVISKLLKNNNKTISTAESCTGGKLASLITSISGASEYFRGSVVAYANDIKIKILGVPAEIIATNGAVSQTVVEIMAQQARELFNTDYAIATSGIAGPEGGTPEKPVGTVWIAVSSHNQTITKMYSFGDNNRERNIQRTSSSALNELRKLILLETEGE